MFSFQKIKIENNLFQFFFMENNNILLWKNVINLWKNHLFIDFFTEAILSCNMDNFFWECPSISLLNINTQPFTCFIIKCNAVIKTANKKAFEEYFNTSKRIVHFYNKDKSALLIVPKHLNNYPEKAYINISNFLKYSPKYQLYQLFNEISKDLCIELKNNKCIWLNTHGLGVYWLHIRLDTYPKYYHTLNIISK